MEEGVKILIFEDSVVDNLLIENSLLKSGQNFIINSVSSKYKFIESISRFQPDIVITGYPLQAENGAEAISIVKQNLPDAACFFVTGEGGEKVSEIFNGQVFDYIPKNNLVILVPAINRAVARLYEKSKIKAAEAKHKARLAQQLTVKEISSMMLSGVGVKALFKKVSGIIMDITGAKSCAMYKIIATSYLQLLEDGGLEKQELVIDLNSIPRLNEILSGKEPYLIVPSEPAGSGTSIVNNFYSNIIMPLGGKERTFGIIMGFNIAKPVFDEEGVELLIQISNILGGAMEKRHSEKVIKFPSNELDVPAEMAENISFTLNINGAVTEINDVGCKILGYLRQNIIGKNWFSNFVPKEVGGELELSFENHLSENKETSYHDEYKIITASGEEKSYQWNCTTVKNRDGFISHVICNGEGPSRENADIASMAYSSQFDIFDQLNDAVMVINPYGTVVYWNRAAENIFGYTSVEITGKNPGSFYFLNFQDETTLSIAALFENFGNAVYWNGKTKEGNDIKLHTTTSPLYNSDGKLAMLVCVGREIVTVIEDNSEALNQAEIRYKSLFNNNPIPLFIFDRHALNILDINDAAIEHYGYSNEEFMKMNIADLRYSDGVASFIDDLNIWSIDGHFKYEVRHRKQSGEGIDVEITSMPVTFEGKKAGLAVINDVTDLKIAQTSLRNSEIRYNNLFLGNPLPMWVYDNETLRFLAVNDAATSHYGFSRDEFMTMHAKDLKLVTVKDVSTSFHDHDAWEHGSMKHAKKDGSVIDVEITSHIIDFDGRKARLVLANDVTEKLRASEATRQNEANLKSLIENTQDAILSLDKDLKIVFINTPAKKMLEKICSIEIKKGVKLFDSVPQQELPFDYNAVVTALDGKRSILEVAREKDGQNFFYEVSVNPIINHNGEISGVSCFSRDITERKIAELKIRRSEEKFRRLIEIMHEGVVYSDIEGRIQFVNNTFCRVTGYSPEELLGKQSVKNLLAAESADLLSQKMDLRKKGIGDQYELKMRKKSGEIVWALVNGVPLLDDAGEVVGGMDTYIDITEMKTAEAKLKSINQELNTFVYKSSHDLKGPLASIKGLTSIARDEITDEDGKRYFGLIAQSTDRLDHILTDLLETVKLKETTVTTEKIDLNALIKDVLNSLEHGPDFERVSFRINITPNLFIYSDKKILTSVMQNLIDNGVKYRRHDLDNSFVSISIADYKSGITIKMEDNGLGIPEDIQDKVFDMFYRGHSESKGTGLGLYIVKNAVEKLGGTIELQSKVSEGTIFTIFLPNLTKN